MDKYTYWSYLKGGKFHIKCLFNYNKMSWLHFNQGDIVYALGNLHKLGQLYKITWYWEEVSGLSYQEKYRTYKNLTDILQGSHPYKDRTHWNQESPFIGDRGEYNLRHWGKNKIKKNPIRFEEFFDELFTYDIIENPLPLLGYVGKIGEEDMNQNLKNLSPPVAYSPAAGEKVLKELRQRVNIVPYKENLYHQAYNFFTDGTSIQILQQQGEDAYVKAVHDKINRVKNLFQNVTSMLEYNHIPYKLFNLDRDSYVDVFKLHQDIPRYSSDGLFTSLPEKYMSKVKGWVEDYLCSQ